MFHAITYFLLVILVNIAVATYYFHYMKFITVHDFLYTRPKMVLVLSPFTTSTIVVYSFVYSRLHRYRRPSKRETRTAQEIR